MQYILFISIFIKDIIYALGKWSEIIDNCTLHIMILYLLFKAFIDSYAS
jgi:hypothetical protein